MSSPVIFMNQQVPVRPVAKTGCTAPNSFLGVRFLARSWVGRLPRESQVVKMLGGFDRSTEIVI